MVDPFMPLPSRADDPRLDGWYHTIELGSGLTSKGVFDHRSCAERVGLPPSLEGKTALDVGTADGFWAFEMERRGADRVKAIDVMHLGDCDWIPTMRARLPESTLNDVGWPRRFATAPAMRQSRVEYQICSVYDLSPETVGGLFDVVYCGSLLLHLQHPLRALINIRSVTKEMAIIETAAIEEDVETQFPDRPYVFFGHLHAEEHPGANNVFWGFSTKALCNMLTYAGFASVEPIGRITMDYRGSQHPGVPAVARV